MHSKPADNPKSTVQQFPGSTMRILCSNSWNSGESIPRWLPGIFLRRLRFGICPSWDTSSTEQCSPEAWKSKPRSQAHSYSSSSRETGWRRHTLRFVTRARPKGFGDVIAVTCDVSWTSRPLLIKAAHWCPDEGSDTCCRADSPASMRSDDTAACLVPGPSRGHAACHALSRACAGPRCREILPLPVLRVRRAHRISPLADWTEKNKTFLCHFSSNNSTVSQA